MIKVFISYKTEDVSTALRVKNAIGQKYGFDTYLDKVDDSLLKDDPALAEHLLKRIGECDQLLAVVSKMTAASWWVPWEIGVGSERRYFLATYLQDQVELPTYLRKWPILRSDADIEKYCELSRRLNAQRDVALVKESTTIGKESASTRMATLFHAELRRALGQSR